MNMVRNEGGSAPAQFSRAVQRSASQADSVPRVHCWHKEAANGGDREGDGGSSSAERTLMILELFSAVRRPLAVGEVSSLVGIPQSSTSVLLRRLQERGYLHYIRVRRAYLPTPRVLLLGSWMLDDGVMAVAARAARRIFDEVGCPALVGMRDGLHMRNVHAEGWERGGGFEVGRAMPLTKTALGKLMLSKLQPLERMEVVRRLRATERIAAIDVEAVTSALHRYAHKSVVEEVAADGRRELAILLPVDAHAPQIGLIVLLCPGANADEACVAALVLQTVAACCAVPSGSRVHAPLSFES